MSKKHHQAIKQLMNQQQLSEAEAQHKAYLEQSTPTVYDYNLLGIIKSQQGDYAAASKAFEQALTLDANHVETLTNVAVCYRSLGDYKRALEILQKLVEQEPHSAQIHDGLAELYGVHAMPEQSRHHGEQALICKHNDVMASHQVYPLPEITPPTFRPFVKEENIISFSLWGNDTRYTSSAVENARRMRTIYPGWKARFYVDETVPVDILNQLQALAAQVVQMPADHGFPEKTFWRFQVMDDPTIKRYIVRDADAVINTQERVAVDAWIAAGTYFHIMRDAWSHTDLMLAGMFGGISGALPPLKSLLQDFTPTKLVGKGLDQVFLNAKVWPTAYQSATIHDRCFGVLKAEPFPPFGRLPPWRHVGENYQAAEQHERNLLTTVKQHLANGATFDVK